MDRSFLVRYGLWFDKMAKGDFAVFSDRSRSSPLSSALAGIPSTLRLVLGGLFASMVLTALTMAILLSHLGPQLRHVGSVLTKIGPAVPVFVAGIFLLQIYLSGAVWDVGVLATNRPSYILASITLGIIMAYGMVRILGPATIQTMNTGPQNLPAPAQKCGQRQIGPRRSERRRRSCSLPHPLGCSHYLQR